MKKLIFSLAICTLTIVSAQAQTKHEKVLKLIHLMQADDMINKSFDAISGTITQQVQSEAKDSTAKAKAKGMMETVMSAAKEMTKQLINEDMVTLYEKYFTATDIDSYIRFYESPAGKKMVAVQPDMQKDMMNVMFSKYIPQFKAKIEAKAKEMKEGEKK